MSDDTTKTYYGTLAQAIEQTLREFGPLMTNGILDHMREHGIGFMRIRDEVFGVPVEDVQRILQMNDNFVRGDSNRWHLTANTK